MQQITLQGKQYPVAFNMTTVLTFEEVADKPFFGETFARLREQMILVFAAVYAADKKSTLTVDILMQQQDWDEFKQAFAAVIELSTEFFHIPAVVAAAEQAEDDAQSEGEKTNN